jgi:hypothetical protein
MVNKSEFSNSVTATAVIVVAVHSDSDDSDGSDGCDNNMASGDN